MGEAEQFDRTEVAVDELSRNGSERGTAGGEVASGAVGTPLPVGSGGKARAEGQPGRGNVPPPGRSLSVSAEASSGMQWAMGVMKQAVPFVQKLLPLLDGQIVTAVASLLSSRPHTPPPPVNLQPIENGLAELDSKHRSLKEQLTEQNASLKRVEDHLQMVREATDRNTLEQQELIEDLKAMGSRVNLLALLFLGLLVLSVLLNIFLFLHIQRVLP